MTDSGQLGCTDIVLLASASSSASIGPIAPHVAMQPRRRSRSAWNGADIADNADLGPVVRALCRYRGAIAATFRVAAFVIADLI